MMDIDLTEYDQVDEAKYLMDQRDNLASKGDLLSTMSSGQASCSDYANCENDFVFLSTPTSLSPAAKTTNVSINTINDNGRNQTMTSTALTTAAATTTTTTTLTTITAAVMKADACLLDPKQRVSHPLMTINHNVGNNPFSSSLHTVTNDINCTSSSSQTNSKTSHPFWMKMDSLASKPIGILETDPSVTVSSAVSSNASHLSGLMQQIVTKSDSIYIAIPCTLCNEPKACPPSDISAWTNHLNRVHNCKICPICNKLVGLGPMRDVEIMRKHVVTHIDDEWLEGASPKTNFSFGLQQHWFLSGRCCVRDPRKINRV